MSERLTKFDPADYLTSDRAVSTFINDARKTGDVGYVAHALGIVARAKVKTAKASDEERERPIDAV